MPKTVSEPDPPKEIGALVRGRGGFTPAWATAIVCAIGLHAVWWWICEPPTLFSDFFKAYYPAAEHLWEAGLASQWPFTEAGAGGFVNLPILAWLFVPLVPLGEVTAGWVFLGIGIVACWLLYSL